MIVTIALPDLPRWLRIRYYNNSPQLRDYYQAREDVLDAKRGRMFKFDDYVLCYTFIDYLDVNRRDDVPDETPQKVETGAAKIRVKLKSGWEEYDFSHPQRGIVEILDLTIERECRMSGIFIAFLGTIMAILGVLL